MEAFGLLAALHPLVQSAAVAGIHLLCRDIEFACDEAVLRQLGMESKKRYSEALLGCSISKKTLTACPLAFGEVGVKARIKSVLNYKSRLCGSFWRRC